MKSFKKLLLFIMIAVIISHFVGCASHSVMRGSVAMKISDDEAHVCLGNKEVKVGDKVNVFKNVCIYENSKARRSAEDAAKVLCTKKIIGSGVVTNLINEHYSIVKFDNKFNFNEGTVVEKQQ